MVPIISLILCSRIEGNDNHNLEGLLDSLEIRTADPKKIEVLIKFDEDDSERESTMENLMINRRWSFPIKTNVAPRWRGYADIHKGYATLLHLLNPDSHIVGAVADDFVCIKDGWDRLFRMRSSGRGLFVLHGHPVSLDFAWDQMDKMICDEAPFWSRELLFAVSSYDKGRHEDFNSIWPIYATDAWTLALEKELKESYGVSIGIASETRPFQRCFNPSIDGTTAPRFSNERYEVFETTKSKAFRDIIKMQAQAVQEALKSKGDQHGVA